MRVMADGLLVLSPEKNDATNSPTDINVECTPAVELYSPVVDETVDIRDRVVRKLLDSEPVANSCTSHTSLQVGNYLINYSINNSLF